MQWMWRFRFLITFFSESVGERRKFGKQQIWIKTHLGWAYHPKPYKKRRSSLENNVESTTSQCRIEAAQSFYAISWIWYCKPSLLWSCWYAMIEILRLALAWHGSHNCLFLQHFMNECPFFQLQWYNGENSEKVIMKKPSRPFNLGH